MFGQPQGAPEASGTLPPDDLMSRIGIDPAAIPDPSARVALFEQVGRTTFEDIRSVLPPGIDWAGRLVLDFGCGSGRTLRWMLAGPARGAQFVGCDIHQPTIEWMQAHYPSQIRLYTNNSSPPLPERDATFDLIYSVSVFSHITNWAEWLIEMRRVLKPGGILVASVHGSGFWEQGLHGSNGEPWREDETGILMEHVGASFEDSFGPAVYVSEWWVRDHWGRALEIERFEPAGFGIPDNRDIGQAWVVARRGSDMSTVVADDLTAPSDDPRECVAATRAQRLAYQEIAQLQAYVRNLRGSL